MATQGPETGGFRDINVTPLVDVMLVLLIVFMITAPLMATKLDVELPAVDGVPTTVREEEIVVVVSHTGVWHVQDAPIGADASAVLRERLQLRSDRRVIVQADGATRYEDVAQAIVDVRQAGAAAVDLWVAGKESP